MTEIDVNQKGAHFKEFKSKQRTFTFTFYVFYDTFTLLQKA